MRWHSSGGRQDGGYKYLSKGHLDQCCRGPTDISYTIVSCVVRSHVHKRDAANGLPHIVLSGLERNAGLGEEVQHGGGTNVFEDLHTNTISDGQRRT